MQQAGLVRGSPDDVLQCSRRINIIRCSQLALAHRATDSRYYKEFHNETGVPPILLMLASERETFWKREFGASSQHVEARVYAGYGPTADVFEVEGEHLESIAHCMRDSEFHARVRDFLDRS